VSLLLSAAPIAAQDAAKPDHSSNGALTTLGRSRPTFLWFANLFRIIAVAQVEKLTVTFDATNWKAAFSGGRIHFLAKG